MTCVVLQLESEEQNILSTPSSSGIYNQRITIRAIFSFEVRVLRKGEIDRQANLSNVILEGHVVVRQINKRMPRTIGGMPKGH